MICFVSLFQVWFSSFFFLPCIHSSSFQYGFLSLNGCHGLILTYYSLKKCAPSHESRCLTQTYRLDVDRYTDWSVWRIQAWIHKILRVLTKSPQYGRFYSPKCWLPAVARISKQADSLTLWMDSILASFHNHKKLLFFCHFMSMVTRAAQSSGVLPRYGCYSCS